MNSEIRNPKSEIRNSKMDLDELLHEFFRLEMPQPWPAFAGLKIENRGLRIEEESRAKPPSRQGTMRIGDLVRDPLYPMLDLPSSNLYARSSTRSRVVLAASVALLLIGSWCIGQQFSMNQPVSSPSSSGKMIGSKLKT